MSLAEGLVWVLRAFGVLYVLGAVFLVRQLRMDAFLDRAISQIETMTDEIGADLERKAPTRSTLPPDDPGRRAWLMSGAVLLFIAGVAMAIGHRLAVPLMVLLIVQQLAYFMRQRRRELRAATPEEAADARPAQSTRNGLYWCLVLTVFAAWLGWQGALL